VGGDFDSFYAAHLERHAAPAALAGAFVGDSVVGLGALVALRRGSRTRGAALVGAGFGIQLLGHVIGNNTLRQELEAVRRHPVWGIVADLKMFLALARRGRDPAR
jgi:hypothetical protein